MEIPEILQNKKVLLGLAGVGVVLFIWKPWESGSSGAGASALPQIDYGPVGGSPDQSAEIASQVNSMQSSILGQVGQMLTAYQQQSDAQTQALSQGFTQAMSQITAQMGTLQNQFQTQQQNQAQYFESAVNRIAQTAAPAQTSNPQASVPTITVAAGSPEARYLNDEYGGKVHIVVSTSNQFVGTDRTQTNAMYRNYLGSLGIAPQNSLNNDQLWSYGG